MTAAEILAAVLPSLCVSVIMLVFTRKLTKKDEAAKRAEDTKKSSERVQVALLVTTAKLSYAVAMSIKNGRTNGEVEDGIEQYREAMKEFKKFERDLVAEKSSN